MDGQDPWCSLLETGDKIVKLRVQVQVHVKVHVKVKAHFNLNDQTHDAQMRLLSSSGSGSEKNYCQPLLFSRFVECAKDPETKVLILTGADPYYCAGVDLSASIQPMHPK